MKTNGSWDSSCYKASRKVVAMTTIVARPTVLGTLLAIRLRERWLQCERWLLKENNIPTIVHQFLACPLNGVDK